MINDEKQLKNIADESVMLAGIWQNTANKTLTSKKRRFLKKMHRFLNHAADKIIINELIDISFRSKSSFRAADNIIRIFKKHGIPKSFTPFEKLLIELFIHLGKYFAWASVPLFVKTIKNQSKNTILSEKNKDLQLYFSDKKANNFMININHLGEAVLGEQEVLRRFDIYEKDLKNPSIEKISIKISTLYSQIKPIAFDHCVDIVSKRLTKLFYTAKSNFYITSKGIYLPKLVTLDMEESTDIEITIAAFTKTMDQKDFLSFTAGIALQAYLPDSYFALKKLTKWAKKRVENQGAGVIVRIVKGANLEMEKVNAALKGWPLPTFDTKICVDANFKKMLNFALKKENIFAIKPSIGSHNLFDIAYGLNIARYYNTEDNLTIELLYGMSDHISSAIFQSVKRILFYTPLIESKQFINAIAYLIRRLDENTGKENFLRYASDLNVDSKNWNLLKKAFIDSAKYRLTDIKTTNKVQDRNSKVCSKTGTFYVPYFINESDTDFSIAVNRQWAEKIKTKWEKDKNTEPIEIPIVIAGEEIYTKKKIIKCFDPSLYNDSNKSFIQIAKSSAGSADDVKKAVSTAAADIDKWRDSPFEIRHKILSDAAQNIRVHRADLIGAACANTGKIFSEADAEVSEAVDFLEYYPLSLKKFYNEKSLNILPKGTGIVISPWNFPIAIPTGGIAASLAAGNCVIFKPSSAAVIPAWILCKCFWEAGVSKNTLQFLPVEDTKTKEMLCCEPDIDYIIFTGGTDTALKILNKRPEIYFAGETGGKNATIVTSLADRDQAVKNIMVSAFGNCGQKCSATSLLILEKEVYNDQNFKKQLIDAVQSINTGSAWNFKNKMGPLTLKPGKKLKKALTSLEKNEEWALKPKNIDNNPHMWTPGIKWGVLPGSNSHLTEFFGPVLSVMCASNLDHAIELANQTKYGLTAGIETLDENEKEFFKKKINAGNIYINRKTTGAIVLKQPFGGVGKSSLGPMISAGGPNYAIQFSNISDHTPPSISEGLIQNHPMLIAAQSFKNSISFGKHKEFKKEIEKTVAGICNYLYIMESEFSQRKDCFHLRGQDNISRYIPLKSVVIRVEQEDSLSEILLRIAGARIAGTTPVISICSEASNNQICFLETIDGQKICKNSKILIQNDEQLIEIMPKIDVLRYGAPERVPEQIIKTAAKHGFYIAVNRVSMHGIVELLCYFYEQNISNNFHRYGNLGARAKEYE